MTALDPSFLQLPLAHRGLHAGPACPENSAAAMQAALDHGYGIELDVQISADGRAMVFHDDTLDRLTPASGFTSSMRAAELARLPLAGGTQTIPTLQDVLRLVSGKVPLLIEIKDQDHALGPDIGALEQAVAKDLRGYNGPVAVMSFNPASSLAMAKLAPDVPRGLTTCAFTPAEWPDVPENRLAELAKLDWDHTVGATFISHDRNDLSNPRVAELRATGLAILCWTIRSQEQENAARQLADNVTFEGYLAHLPRA